MSSLAAIVNSNQLSQPVFAASVNLTGQLLEDLLCAGSAMSDRDGFSEAEMNELDAILLTAKVPVNLLRQFSYRLAIIASNPSGTEDVEAANRILAQLIAQQNSAVA